MKNSTNKRTILLVEDDPTLGPIYQESLQERLTGYKVELYTQADQALERYKSASDIAVVCTDGNLADNQTGWGLGLSLRNAGFDRPIIYIGDCKLRDSTLRLSSEEIGVFNVEYQKPFPQGIDGLIDLILSSSKHQN